jgi:hypothetical protein
MHSRTNELYGAHVIDVHVYGMRACSLLKTLLAADLRDGVMLCAVGHPPASAMQQQAVQHDSPLPVPEGKARLSLEACYM